jgi:hypothetical protein
MGNISNNLTNKYIKHKNMRDVVFYVYEMCNDDKEYINLYGQWINTAHKEPYVIAPELIFIKKSDLKSWGIKEKL